jgi:hypothetical protein
LPRLDLIVRDDRELQEQVDRHTPARAVRFPPVAGDSEHERDDVALLLAPCLRDFLSQVFQEHRFRQLRLRVAHSAPPGSENRLIAHRVVGGWVRTATQT